MTTLAACDTETTSQSGGPEVARPQADAPTTQTVDDTAITTQVREKLSGDESVAQVQVETKQGVVHLTGEVESAEARQRADDLARQVEGVQGVVNNLVVRAS
jgi:osmotically-inducible protein OsmY